jgi:hypothetical protein
MHSHKGLRLGSFIPERVLREGSPTLPPPTELKAIASQAPLWLDRIHFRSYLICTKINCRSLNTSCSECRVRDLLCLLNHTRRPRTGEPIPVEPRCRGSCCPHEVARPAGGRDDQVEQLRNYQSVYAAVNAIAQEIAMQRPTLYLNTARPNLTRRRCRTTTRSPGC